MMNPRRGFASDNNAAISPEILAAITQANVGHALGYGSDPWTKAAEAKVRETFGDTAEAFFVFNGTAANVLALSAAVLPHQAVICSAESHLHVDECGAPERFLGAKLLLAPPSDGKISPDTVKPFLKGFGDPHHVQPRAISIAQTTELGTVYRPEEIQRLAELAHAHGMVLHVDGARLANAAASLGSSLRALTTDAGVDLVSFGGTKNGLLGGECVVLLNTALTEGFMYRRKQAMQLASKMRFISAQFTAYLSNELWRKNAAHANAMARALEVEVKALAGIQILYPVEANALFVRLPRAAAEAVQRQYYFYILDDSPALAGHCDARWMASPDTTLEDIRSFVALLRSSLSEM